ncbi:MAG: subclass B3 metallo-beta-lactamase [Bacteroidota bacterium]
MPAWTRALRRRRRYVVLGIVALLLAVAYTQWQAAITRNRQIPDAPFRIAGNLYYVGHTGVSAFLLTGSDGHVLIDGGYPENGPMIAESIAQLGYDIADVKVLLNSHAHADHAGGLRFLQDASGAALWVSEGDAEVMASGGAGDPTLGPFRHMGALGLGRFPAPRVDRRFVDGDTVRVGSIELTAHVTAGHTRGCTSWSFPMVERDRTLLAVSICSLKLFPFVSVAEPEAYPGIRADYERSFATLRSLPADLFLASHPIWFDMHRKRRAQADAEHPASPFIDREGYLRFIDRSEARFFEILASQQ